MKNPNLKIGELYVRLDFVEFDPQKSFQYYTFLLVDIIETHYGLEYLMFYLDDSLEKNIVDYIDEYYLVNQIMELEKVMNEKNKKSFTLPWREK